jgi:hypothetical protein
MTLRELALTFQPGYLEFDSAINHHLSGLDIQPKLEATTVDSATTFCAIVLLKSYTYHLTTAGQSYNLMNFRSGNAAKIIDWYCRHHSIPVSAEFLSSAIVTKRCVSDGHLPSTDPVVSTCLQRISGANEAIKSELDSLRSAPR